MVQKVFCNNDVDVSVVIVDVDDIGDDDNDDDGYDDDKDGKQRFIRFR